MDSKGRGYIAGQLCNEADNLEETLEEMRRKVYSDWHGVRWPARLVSQMARLDHLRKLARARCQRRFDAWCDTQVDN